MKKIIAVVLALCVIAAGVAVAYNLLKVRNNDHDFTINVSYDDFTLYDTLFTNVHDHPDRYYNSFIMNYSMDDKTAKSIIDTPEEWLSFNLFVNISNPNDKTACILDIDVKDNGKDDVYIQEALSSTMDSISGGGDYSLCIPVLVHNNEPSLEQVKEIVMKKDIYINFAEEPENPVDSIPSELIYQAKVQMQ